MDSDACLDTAKRAAPRDLLLCARCAHGYGTLVWLQKEGALIQGWGSSACTDDVPVESRIVTVSRDLRDEGNLSYKIGAWRV